MSKGRHIALCGFGDSYVEAPFNDPNVVIYGLNELYKYLPRWDEWIEVHDEESIGLTNRVGPGQNLEETARHRKWLEQAHAGKTIWMQERFCDGRFPAAKPFPIERVKSTINALSPVDGRDYFTSSVALMLAHVITNGRDSTLRIVDEALATAWIGLYGIELVGEKEYEDQRPCVEWLIGLATGIGIKVEIAKKSALMKADHVYGYQVAPKASGPVTLERIDARIAQLTKQHDELVTQIQQIKGARIEAQNWRTVILASARGVQELPPNFLGVAK